MTRVLSIVGLPACLVIAAPAQANHVPGGFKKAFRRSARVTARLTITVVDAVGSDITRKQRIKLV